MQDDAARLERALDRIARQARPRAPSPDHDELIARLDALIEKVRGVLAPPED